MRQKPQERLDRDPTGYIPESARQAALCSNTVMFNAAISACGGTADCPPSRRLNNGPQSREGAHDSSLFEDACSKNQNVTCGLYFGTRVLKHRQFYRRFGELKQGGKETHDQTSHEPCKLAESGRLLSDPSSWCLSFKSFGFRPITSDGIREVQCDSGVAQGKARSK